MEMQDALRLYGKTVRVVCDDGDMIEGRFRFRQTFADEPDEPESIGIDIGGAIMDIPVLEVAEMREIGG